MARSIFGTGEIAGVVDGMGHIDMLRSRRGYIYPLLFLTLTLCASSQVQNGEITGTVTDPSGAVVSGAKIVLRNLGTHYAGPNQQRGDLFSERDQYWHLYGLGKIPWVKNN